MLEEKVNPNKLFNEFYNVSELQRQVSDMDNYFALGNVNMAFQEAGKLLYSLNMVAEQGDGNENLLQVSLVDCIIITQAVLKW